MSPSFYIPLKLASGQTLFQVRLPEPLHLAIYPFPPSISLTHLPLSLSITALSGKSKQAILLFLLNGGSIHSAINASILTPNRFHPAFFYERREGRPALLLNNPWSISQKARQTEMWMRACNINPYLFPLSHMHFPVSVYKFWWSADLSIKSPLDASASRPICIVHVAACHKSD